MENLQVHSSKIFENQIMEILYVLVTTCVHCEIQYICTCELFMLKLNK